MGFGLWGSVLTFDETLTACLTFHVDIFDGDG